MTSQLAEITSGAVLDQVGARSAQQSLRMLVITAGVGTSILFIVAGLAVDLQIFGDGSIFAYSVAAQDAWAFHWHNISGRLFGYLYSFIPAETYVALTKDPKGGIAIYGLLRFSAQLLGLIVTLSVDRTKGRTIFVYACLSTACICPLAFGAPTEMLLTHALFWPALAICHSAPASARGAVASVVGLLLLVLTHEGAVILSAVILFAAFPRNGRGTAFIWVVAAWFAAMTIWLIVKLAIRPDDYIAGVLAAAAYKFIDIRNLVQPIVLLLLATLAGYGIAAALLRRLSPARAHVYAAVGCATWPRATAAAGRAAPAPAVL